VYIDRTFGPLAGTVVGLGLWISALLKSSFALVGFGAYLLAFTDINTKWISIGILALLVFLNVRGVGKISKAQIVIVLASLACLAALAIAGLVGGEVTAEAGGTDLRALGDESKAMGVATAMALVFVAYNGVIKVCAIAEEVKNPQRNLPLGIILSLLSVTIVYAGVTFVMTAVVPVETLSGTENPVYLLAFAVGGKWAGMGAAIVGILALISMANAGLLASSRYPFAMARDQLLPPILRRLHSRFLTPVAAILLSGGLMAGAILLFDVHAMAELASAFLITIYAANNLAVIVLRESRTQWYKPEFKSPLYPLVQILGVIFGVTLLIFLEFHMVAATFAVALPGALLYLFYGRKRAKRRGVFSKRGRRADLLAPGGETMDEHKAHELTGEAAVVVALFGNERSPEMLVEMATALSDAGDVEVVHLSDVPEQTALDAALEEDRSVASLRRRIVTMADKESLSVKFEALASHDTIRTAFEISNTLHCKWMVMEWGGRQRGSLTLSNPLGWLRSHLSCNLATFYDSGVRYLSKILVYAEPGPHDALAVHTADRLAKLYGAGLTFVRFVRKGAPLTQLQAEADYLDQVRRLCRTPSETLIVRGKDEARAIGEQTPGFDLLVTGESGDSGLVRQFFPSSREKLVSRAACSVLTLRTPRELTHEAFEIERKEKSADFKLEEFIEATCVSADIK
ncbi:MAG: universal stress protein, partial [Nitrospira sp.]|nr:universal stress protein [Nitrospira sp.]